MHLLMSTGNPHKLEEARNLLKPLGYRVFGLSEILKNPPEVVEDLDTLEGNAMKKAKEIAALTKMPTFSDDTGLEVDALNGAPGVFSARYAGPDADAQANRDKMLKEMESKQDRKAQFRTVIAFIADGKEYTFEGSCPGEITVAEHGEKGFGYDKIFSPEGHEKTFAEMTMDEKSTVSHRGKALLAFATFLEKYEDKD